MSNYKTQVSAYEIASALAIRLNSKLPAYTEVGGESVVTWGVTSIGGNGGSIRILDQRANVDVGFDDIIGNPQKVYTTGVAQIIVASTGIAADAAIDAWGTFSFTAPIGAGSALTIGTVTLTEGVDFAKGASQNTAGDAFAVAVNADLVLKKIVKATSVHGAGAAACVVTIVALQPGPIGNQIAISSADACVVANTATLANGTGSVGFIVSPLTLLTVLAECGIRGLGVELYEVDFNLAPTFANVGSAVFKGSFDTQIYWPLSGRV